MFLINFINAKAAEDAKKNNKKNPAKLSAAPAGRQVLCVRSSLIIARRSRQGRKKNNKKKLCVLRLKKTYVMEQPCGYYD
jgi:hypothetical protein